MTDLLELALREYGVREISGDEDNPRIMQYAKETNMSFMQHDEDAWCSVFINWVAMKVGRVRSGLANARSWLHIGDKVDVPTMGDIVILWRVSPDSWKGHVGIYISEDANNIFILGGNQDNAVNIRPYPKERLLGYRHLPKSLIS